MTGQDTFEIQLERLLRELSDPAAGPARPDMVASAVAARRGAHGGVLRRRIRFDPTHARSRSWSLIGAAAVVGVAVLGGLLLVGVQRGQPSIGGPTLVPGTASVAPSATPTATPTAAPPSPTVAPILWTGDSLDADWPGAVRPEPPGGAVVLRLADYVPRGSEGDGGASLYPDPTGDVGPSIPWIDIREVHVSGSSTGVIIELVDDTPPLVAPSERWIAYGVVMDTDRDGQPDVRYGIDNIPSTAPGEDQHRAWITDLDSGRTESKAGPGYGAVGDTFFDTFYPGEWTGIGARLKFGGDTTGPGPNGGGIVGGIRSPFYVWASLIEDGGVVATDYAPETGWLEPVPRKQRP
jgi:hypothetical protein